MKILFAGDEHPYSAYALKEVIRLALNTWADVTLMAVSPAPAVRGARIRRLDGSSLPRPCTATGRPFWTAPAAKGSPYARRTGSYEWIPLKGGRWEELLVGRGAKKDLKVCLRAGNAAQEILAEAREEESDLIVLGCTKGEQCLWQGAAPVPQKVVNDADCSVLLVKEEQPITRILACLDQSYISQDSLEMINQMATIHGAQLELIGLSQEGDLKKDVYRRLIEIGDYYEDRQIKVTTRLTEIADFESFVGPGT